MNMADVPPKSISELYTPDSPAGTEFLRLYHSLLRDRDSTPGARAFLITSATVGEGKSTVASFLAMTLASIKKKTLLLDADLRRPSIHKLFNLYLEDGIAEVSDGGLPLARAYKETPLSNLHVLTAGRLKGEPSAYFEAGHVSQILGQARQRFDFIVVDSAPVMPVVDPMVMAGDVSGVLMVVKAGGTHRELVRMACDNLLKVNAPLKGIVLNDVKQVLPTYHGNRYAYYQYASANGSKPGSARP